MVLYFSKFLYNLKNLLMVYQTETLITVGRKQTPAM